VFPTFDRILSYHRASKAFFGVRETRRARALSHEERTCPRLSLRFTFAEVLNAYGVLVSLRTRFVTRVQRGQTPAAAATLSQRLQRPFIQPYWSSMNGGAHNAENVGRRWPATGAMTMSTNRQGGFWSWFVPPVVIPALMVIIILAAAWLNN